MKLWVPYTILEDYFLQAQNPVNQFNDEMK